MKLVATEKAPKALGPYSQGYIYNGVFYAAGQIAINPATDAVEADTIEGQTEQVCKNIGELIGQGDVDGALVGGASLDGEQFATLSAIAAGGPLP